MGAPGNPMAIALLFLGLLAGCGGGAEEAARLRRLFAPHRAEFSAFDDWARRTGLAESAFRTADQLHETAFAPLRRNAEPRFAWIEQVGVGARRLSFPRDAPNPPRSGWVRAQVEPLGQLWLIEQRLRGEPWLVAKRILPAPREAELHVMLAFPLPEP